MKPGTSSAQRYGVRYQIPPASSGPIRDAPYQVQPTSSPQRHDIRYKIPHVTVLNVMMPCIKSGMHEVLSACCTVSNPAYQKCSKHVARYQIPPTSSAQRHDALYQIRHENSQSIMVPGIKSRVRIVLNAMITSSDQRHDARYQILQAIREL